jgi:hypothetical protein
MLSRYEFPLESLPSDLAKSFANLQDINGIHCAYSCTAFLVACSAAIGSRVSLRISQDNFTMLNLYALLVGKSGTGKSPAIRMVLKQLREIDREMQDRNRQLALEFMEQKKNKGEKLPLPPMEHLIMDDFTHESLLFELQNNPHGLLLSVDEYTQFESNLGRYTDGSPLNHYMTIWDNHPVKVTRKTQAPIYIYNPFLSFISTNQPSRLRKSFASNTDSGFFQRFLIAEPKEEIRVGLPEKPADTSLISQVIEGIYRSIPIKYDGEKRVPNVIKFTKEGLDAYRNLIYENVTDEIKADEYLSSAQSKMARAAARISAILSLIHSGWLSDVGATFVEKAAEIYQYYMEQHIYLSTSDKSPANELPWQQLVIYKALPDEFRREEAIDLCIKEKVSPRTLARLLNNRKVISKVGKIFRKNYI